MVGGLALSQLLTLFTTPVIYLYLDRLGNWRERKLAAAAARSPDAGDHRVVASGAGRAQSVL
jgi:hypothetical protein